MNSLSTTTLTFKKEANYKDAYAITGKITFYYLHIKDVLLFVFFAFICICYKYDYKITYKILMTKEYDQYQYNKPGSRMSDMV